MSEAAGLREGYLDLPELRIHYAEAGAGPLVLLLHGFPESWRCWRHQLPALASAGFRAVAPDMRGYNDSDKPRGVSAYRGETLADDVAAMVQALDASSCFLVGHDWGGAVAWMAAMRHPQLIRKLAILNAPHPGVFPGQIFSSRQFLRSWYLFFFQLPWIPELSLRMLRLAPVRRIFRRDPIRPGAYSEEEIEEGLAALRRPGALTAAINYYRAALRGARPGASPPGIWKRPVEAKTLVLWGMQDRYLLPACAEVPEELAPHLTLERIAEASHWLQVDRPELVNARLVEFFREP